MFTVKKLIQLLETFPPDAPVAYCCYSEQVLMEGSDVTLMEGCLPRADGWVQNERPDKPKQTYVLFPGN